MDQLQVDCLLMHSSQALYVNTKCYPSSTKLEVGSVFPLHAQTPPSLRSTLEGNSRFPVTDPELTGFFYIPVALQFPPVV